MGDTGVRRGDCMTCHTGDAVRHKESPARN